MIVGADACTNGQINEGRAFVYLGNDGAGLPVRPQQRRADDLAAIDRGGRLRTPDGFRLAALGQTPFGRARVKLEREVKARGQFLDGTDTGRGAVWLDTGTDGIAINEIVPDLDPGDYHWRVRLLYDPATSPFQQASRWFTVPWGGQEETDLSQGALIGGTVWEDRDHDGIRESSEPLLGGITVRLLDATETVIDLTLTNSQGGYFFEVDGDEICRLRFDIPTGFQLTLRDQGPDDTLDSDPDRMTGETVQIGPPFQAFDFEGWGAGYSQEGSCLAPDEPVYVYSMRLSTDGNDYPILAFQDPNQPDAVTGYNAYRSSDAGLPSDDWPLVASDVVDMDESEPNRQWVDTSGDVSGSGTWYYHVIAYNSACNAEGPR